MVDGAVDGFATVGGEGFEDKGDAGVVGVGNGGGGLPVGAVPGDGTGGGRNRAYIEQVFRGGSTELERVRAGSARPLGVRTAARVRMPARERAARRRVLGILAAPWGKVWGGN